MCLGLENYNNVFCPASRRDREHIYANMRRILVINFNWQSPKDLIVIEELKACLTIVYKLGSNIYSGLKSIKRESIKRDPYYRYKIKQIEWATGNDVNNGGEKE